MNNLLQQLIQKAGEKLTLAFGIDSVGAIINLFFLLAVLLPFEKVFGMPMNVLIVLSGIVFLYACFSLYCYWFVKKKQVLFLKLIMIANFFYSIVSAILIVAYFHTLTAWGVIYFTIEVLIILAVVFFERAVILHNKKWTVNH